MEKFVAKLRQDYSHLLFKETGLASWSPHSGQISYSAEEDMENIWSLLHEVGHALCNHQTYKSDIELLRKETEAWEKAVGIAKQYDIEISQDHIQSCLDTYRDWLHKRSTCPTCSRHGVQRTESLYSCLNCKDTWKVSPTRFCRPYRLKIAENVN